MDISKDFSRIVSDILSREIGCPRCQSRNSPSAFQCSRCGASLRADEPVVSVLNKEARPPHPTIVELEEASNFVLLRKAARGIQDGTVNKADYMWAVKKLRGVAQKSIEVLQSDGVREKFVGAPREHVEMYTEMLDAFHQLDKGVALMEEYLTNGNIAHVNEGAAKAEDAFETIDRIERWSDNL